MPKNYNEWSQYLFKQQLEHLRNAKSLTINDINAVTKSKYYQLSHRSLCLKALRKIRKTRSIYRLQINPKLSIKNELSYLSGIPFTTKELGNLPKIFDHFYFLTFKIEIIFVNIFCRSAHVTAVK